MRKHILSRYAKKENELEKMKYQINGTLETRIVEISDPDEIYFGPTVITKNMEDSDIDEFMLSGPTKLTFVQEVSDIDEGYNSISFSNDVSHCKDYDEILFI